MNRFFSQSAIAFVVLTGVCLLIGWQWQIPWLTSLTSVVLWLVLVLHTGFGSGQPEDSSIAVENSSGTRDDTGDVPLQGDRLPYPYLLASGPIVIFSGQLNEPYQVTFMSNRAAVLLNYDPHQWLEETNFWLARVASEDREPVLQQLSELRDNGTHSLEYRFLNGDGTYHWLRVDLALINPQSGDSPEIVAYLMDVQDLYQNEEVFRQQAEREQLIIAITQRIRQSLNLESVLKTTVAEVQELLQADRVLIYQFQPDWSGVVVVEAVSEPIFSILGETIQDQCFKEHLIEPYRRGRISAIDNIYTSGKKTCHINLLARYQVQANLVLPILQGLREEGGEELELSSEPASKLWGLLIAHQCKASRQWQTWEIALLQQIAVQVGIATQQSQLYAQTQQQAQQAQALNRVIQAIRNSLELDHIFSTAVAEVANLLQVDRVIIAQYYPQNSLWHSVADYCRTPDFPALMQLDITDTGNEIVDRLKHRQVIQIDNIRRVQDKVNPDLITLIPGAWLVVPLMVSLQVWGSLILVKQVDAATWQDSDVILTRAVADQLAIAIQQSELYQQLQAANAKLEQLATVDDLTQIANRRRLDQHLYQEWYRLLREHACLTVILGDVDYFKRYNDTYGHLAGDHCLWQVAQAIHRAVKRPADLVARYGGEEFAIILPNTDSLGAVQVVHAIQQEIQQLHILHQASEINPYVTLSFGIATIFPDASNTPQQLVDRADQALYLAKENGRNQYYVA